MGHKIVVVVMHRALTLEVGGDCVRKKLGHSFQHLLGFVNGTLVDPEVHLDCPYPSKTYLGGFATLDCMYWSTENYIA